ncbi:beta-lactamase [Apiospora aurea]|uniref:Beta-lactamase n=1 Tax=Apiospora aurea TaxID=335848 RepID=A0ABR1QPB6_9PEZI
MEKLDEILRSYTVSSDELTVKNKLLGAGFVVVDRDGAHPLRRRLGSPRLRARSSALHHTLPRLASLHDEAAHGRCGAAACGPGLLAMDQNLRSLEPELAAMGILRGFDTDDRDGGEEGKPILEPNTRPITLHHLLTHTLGLAMDLPVPDLMRWSRSAGRTAVNLDWTRAGMTTPLSSAPGEGWVYGMAYDWAGSVLEALTKQSLGEWMQRHIFAPLGMERTGFWPERILGGDEKKAGDDRLLEFAFSAEDGITGARPYPDAELRPGTSILRTEHEMESGGAGLFSTPHDYGLFLSGLLRSSSSSSSSSSHHQEQEQETLLKPQTLTQLLTPQLTPPQRAQLTSTVSAFPAGFAPEMPLDGSVRLDHGLGGLINLDDLPGKRRRAGSMTWSGMSNGRWWVDPATGVAAAMFTMVLPHGNDVVNRMWDELERAVYGDLLPGLKQGKGHTV